VGQINDGKTKGHVAKFNSTLSSTTWANSIYNASLSSTNPEFKDVCVDSSDNIYVCGDMRNRSTQISSGTQLGFIYKFNSSGTFQWARALGGNTYNTDIYGIGIDSEGYVAWTGHNTGSGNIYGRLSTSGTSDYINKVTKASTALYDTGNGSVDASGSVYIQTRGIRNGAYEATDFLKLPSDGSLRGTYGDYTIADASSEITVWTTTDAWYTEHNMQVESAAETLADSGLSTSLSISSSTNTASNTTATTSVE